MLLKATVVAGPGPPAPPATTEITPGARARRTCGLADAEAAVDAAPAASAEQAAAAANTLITRRMAGMISRLSSQPGQRAMVAAAPKNSTGTPPYDAPAWMADDAERRALPRVHTARSEPQARVAGCWPGVALAWPRHPGRGRRVHPLASTPWPAGQRQASRLSPGPGKLPTVAVEERRPALRRSPGRRALIPPDRCGQPGTCPPAGPYSAPAAPPSLRLPR